MSSVQTPYYFRRRTIGRASSPPTWACYEQIHDFDDDDYSESGSDSCSEDEEDYPHGQPHDPGNDSEEESERIVDMSHSQGNEAHDVDGMDIEIDDEASAKAPANDIKGKQRAIEPAPEPPQRRHRKKSRQQVYTLRPILTIQRSQGFVWNQVSAHSLFITPGLTSSCILRTSSFLRTSKTDVRILLPVFTCNT